MRLVKNKVFNRRALILGCIQLTVSVIFGYRMYVLQIKDRKKYEILSNKNKVRITNIIPQRGKILDRNGVELAVNEVAYILISSGHDKEISWEEIEFHALKSNIVAFYKRAYPFGSVCSHILGYTRRDANKQIGISGIEYTHDHLLVGIPGKIEQEVNSRQHVVRELSDTSQQDGQNVQLTIDINLHKKISELFQDHKGSVTVIDAKNGELLALYNSPSYDNNLFTSTLPRDTWQSLNDNSLPLVNRALSYQISPGSIFKIIVALTALQDGVITPEYKFFCAGYMKIGERKFRCRKSDGHGYLSLGEAITSSCNIYFYNIGRKINIDSLVEMASKFGLGNGPLMTQFKEESSGLLPYRNWRKQKQWCINDTMDLVIGQGSILATPLQLAVFAARIATGKAVVPCVEPHKVTFPNINISELHLDIVRQSMFDMVNTRVNAPNLPQEIFIAGKTGTPIVDSKGNSQKLFVAYSSSHYAMSVFIEHSKSPCQDCLIAKIFNYMAM